MNPRVLELLRNPKNIQSEDLNLLKEEISSFPYIQNIRALHLYGIHLYDKENYQKELSTTAAYTTDKKILYQLINGKIKQKPKPEIIEEQKPLISVNTFKYIYKSSSFPIKREEKEQQIIEDKKHEEAFLLQAQTIPEIKHLHVNGERNRILFEGEENFLEDDTLETIDLESTLESGSIVTQKAEKKEVEEVINEVENIQEEPISEEVQQENPVEEIAEFTPETIINEENIDSEAQKEKIDNESDVSFYEIEPSLTENETKEDDLVEENNAVSVENEKFNKVEEISEFTPETIINEEKVDSELEEEKIDDESNISFHEIEPSLTENDNSVKENEIVSAENEEFTQTEAKIAFTPEEIINEEEITSESETEKVNNDAELSFHGTDSFLPDVKIQSNIIEETVSEEIPQPSINKHEDEMRRLIEEVEKKMKTVKVSSEQKETEPEISGHEISFSETQNFNVEEPVKENVEEKIEEGQPELVENKPEEVETVEETVNEEIPEDKIVTEEVQEVKSAWKPMRFESHVPDSLINKSTETPQPKVEEVKEEAPKDQEIISQVVEETELPKEDSEEIETIEEPVIEEKIEEPETEEEDEEEEEAPALNVSFFNSDIISSWAVDANKAKEEQQKEKEEATETPAETVSANPIDSNVPGFINTWQSWLKIDRPSDEAEETVEQIQQVEEAEPIDKIKTEIKNKVIESFIENNPKISQLKDEVNFVVKEKTDDISHLMTETLATLYFEQKLYTKAIKAFNILITKHPEKKDYFEGKIQEIKDVRGKN
ncbi:hypothetical protein [Chryseobacterium sp. G0201]|uniref:hypothetical protein n=1 Tax=Chryseobacterium sp. G0201 TaxID=2487065 RepID=UPI000F4DB436|nr:hypothetical protein [Chryseobacterium sp. G0201]AZA52567.1 hypothetical protein EG348_05880 [Chryseobacterium sp. G0201]